MVKKKEVQNNWKKIKKELQVQLDVLSKEAKVLGKKTEVFIKDVSVKGKAATEAMVLRLKREQLYNQLGKAVVKSSRRNKKIDRLRKEIAALDCDIKEKEGIVK